jgi:hypothetical protein
MLYSQGVIDSTDDIREAKPVTQRAARLLQAVRQKHLKAPVLLTDERQLTFEAVFKSKLVQLEKKLEVTDDLLSSLVDKMVIKPIHVEDITKESSNQKKVDLLLDILKSRDDSLLHPFCEILIEDDQRNVVEILLPEGHPMRFKFFPEELDAQLENIIEPDYGVPEVDQSHVVKVIKLTRSS